MYKSGIIRGLMPRLSQAEFVSSWRKFHPVFLTGDADDEIKKYSRKQKIELRDLHIQPLWRIDPLQLLTQRRTHQSWVGVSSLTKASQDIDILETYELYHFFSGQAADTAKRLNIPLVTEVWTSFAKHPAYFLPPYRFTVQKVIQQTSLFIARSKRSAESLKQLGIPASKIKMIYHGVNLKRFTPKQKSSKHVRVLYVGSLEPHKGVALLLSVWPKVLQTFPTAQLWLVGSGGLEEKAKQQENVVVKGYMPYEKLPSLYQSCDIFVSPSLDRYLGPLLWWEEFFSYTLMESLACGLPIIATKSGGIPEEIGKENYLIPQHDSQELLKVLLELVSNKQKREALGKKNRARAESFYDLHKQTAKLESELLKLV